MSGRNSDVGIGMLGAGFIAHIHCDALKHCPRGRLVSVYSRSKERADRLKEQFGFERATTDLAEVARDPDVDVVDVCVPNSLHHAAALEAIRCGEHVIVEKPFARTLTEADEMLEAARGAGVKVMYAENLRFAPALLRAKEIIDSGGIGRPFLIRTTEMHSGPHSDWFWDAAETGGGSIMDMGVHGLFTLEWLMGSPIVRVYAEKDVLVHKERCRNGAEDNAIVTVRFQNGAMGEMVNSWAVQGGIDVRTELFGTDGTILVDLGHGSPMRVYSLREYGPTVEKQELSVGWSFPEVYEGLKGGHIGEMNHFVHCVDADLEPLCSGVHGRRALELVLTAYRSSSTGRAVDVSPWEGG